MAQNGSYLLVTVWTSDEDLRLLVFDLATLAYSTEYNLGDCTEAELNALTYTAFPVTVFDNDDVWYVAGRMNAPQGLSNPEHVIRTTDAGDTWESVEDGWTTGICAALQVGLANGSDERNLYGVKYG
jgi:hypothetical protein